MKIHNRFRNDEEEEEEDNDILIKAAGDSWGPDTLTFFGKDSRAILISGEITQALANCVISQLLELAAESDEPIHVYINTDGGECTSGLAIYDMMRIIPAPVVTVVIGACHSAGLFILQGGDRRGAIPHASFFYHEPISSYQVATEDAAATYTNHYKTLREAIDKILISRSKISKAIWKKDFAGKTAFFFTTEEAIAYKLVDEVVEYAKPKPLSLKAIKAKLNGE